MKRLISILRCISEFIDPDLFRPIDQSMKIDNFMSPPIDPQSDAAGDLLNTYALVAERKRAALGPKQNGD